MKQLKLFFALFAMLALGVGNAWGADDVIDYSTTKSALNSTATSTWKNPDLNITGASGAQYVIHSMGTKGTTNALQWNKNGFLYQTKSGGTLKSVIIKGTNGKSVKIYASTSAYSGAASGTAIATLNLTGSDVTYTFEENSNYTFLAINGSVSSTSIVSITVTYETTSATPDPVDPTVTFSDGNYTVGGTLNLSTLWTSNSDGTVTYTIDNAGTTGASINGKSFTATAAGTCTVKASQASTSTYNAIEKTATITVSAPIPATVTLSEAGVETNVQDKNVGDSYTLPETASQTCGDKVFVGWSTVEISTPGDKPTSNFYEPGTTVTLAAEQTFYAVYATEGEGGGNVFDGTAGGTFKIYAVVDGTNYYAMGTGSKISSTKNEGEATEYTFTKVSDGVFSIKTSTTYITYASSSNLGTNNTTAYNWKISAGTNGTWRIASEATNTRGIIYRASTYKQFGGYALSNATAGSTEYFDVEIGGGSAASYSDYTTSCSGSTETVPSLRSIAANAEGKNEFTVGDEFVKATITATYDDETTKDVTSLATFTGYDMNTIGIQTVNVEYEGKTTTYDITVSAKPRYTITWNNAGTTNTTEVVQGEALGTLPELADCDNGKKFMGWTAATPVNNDGSGIVYVKETDIPTSDITYYAVFAVVEGGDGTPTTATISIEDYANANNWSNGTQYLTMNIDAYITATANGGGNTGKYYTSGTNWRLYQGESATLTISAAEGYEIQTVKVTYSVSNTGVLTLNGTNVTSGTACEINAASVIFGVGNTGSATNGQVRITDIEVVYVPASKTSDYSLDCLITVDPTWTIATNEINFGAKFVGETYTETFTINANNLTEDITLAIESDDFTVSPNSISKDAEFPQTVTVTYAPTTADTHSAELTITSGELSETITLTGQAETPTIYTLTDLANINAKDQVIIVGTNANGTYAMSNDKGTSDAPTAVAVTVSNNVVKTNDATIVWNLVKDGENLTFYPDGTTTTWLYCTNTNNGVRVGTNDNKVFTLDATSGYLKNTATSRYIGVYNSQDWRCYTSYTTDNIKDQSFAFYVLPNTDPSIDVNPESQDFVVALNSSASKEVEITAHNIATPVYSVSINDNTHYTASVNAGKVTITYAPTEAGEHTATLTITETTSSQTATVALTGKCVETMDVADAMETADNTEVALNPFEVVKVISNKNYVYIKDATGASMIFDYNNAHSMGSLVEGATVTGFIGKKSAYNQNPQLTPSVDYSSLSVSGSGTAEATEITELKTEYVNKFVVLKGVEIASNVNISENPTFTVNGNTVASYNQFGRNYDFQASMLYDIYGFVGIYNETIQFWFLEAAQAGSAIEYYTVTYKSGASDVTGNVPVDTKEYAEGESVTLKTCELTREGYTFAGWDVTSTSGSVEVADNKFIMPASDVTVTALWKEIKTYKEGAWVLVTDASDLAVNDDVIIAAANENYALGTDQKSNNRGTGTIVKGSNVALLESNVQIITLESGNKPSTLAFYTGRGYLYAVSSDNNYLRTENELSDNSSWAIEIEESVATIEAQGENKRNLLQYNSNNELFSCYSSKQAPVAIYEYKPNERVITFDVQGGEAYDYTYIATTSGNITLPTAVPTHAAEGQLFSSWNDKEDGSGNTYNVGATYSFTEHTTLYAQWTVANAYHVTYNIAGASGTTPVDLTHYYGGETVTLAPQGDLVNPGHIFAGWKVVDATDTEIMVTDNAFIMPQSDVTATAKWVRQTNDTWVLVTSENQLLVGEKYVIACNTEGAVAGNINTTATNPYMYKLDAAFSDNKELIKALTPEAVVFTLGGTTGAWTFTDEAGKALGATAAKKMAWASGTTTWTLTFDANGVLTMTNTTDSYGALKYNSQSPRFTTYASGQKDIQLYILNPAQVVEGDKTDNDVPQYSNVTVEDGGDLSVENTDTQYGDMYINNGGSVEVDENAQLTVNNLYIQTTMGTTTSGQLNTAPENLIVNGDAFIDITLGKNGDPSQWHAFTVPFPVDAMNGIFDLNDNKLTNGVNYAIMQYHGDVRAQGKYGWKKYSGVLVPGTFYLMTVDGARTTYRFKKVKDAALVAENTKSLSAYTGGGKNTDYGWNGVGNPTLMHGKVDAAVQILDPISYTYQVIAASSAHFTVGTPFFIQAATDGEVAITAEGNSTLAPARRAATTVEKIKVMLGNADYTDHLYVSASEDATNDYEIGKDLVKMVMTNTPIVPQIFAEAYGARLCMVNAPMTSNEATVALNLYAPAEGEYTLSVEEQANATVYLLYNGNIVWNLSMSEYPIYLSQGDNAGYSLVIRRENAPTDVENILGADEQTEKFIYNGKLYILHEGKVFDAVGNVLK